MKDPSRLRDRFKNVSVLKTSDKNNVWFTTKCDFLWTIDINITISLIPIVCIV